LGGAIAEAREPRRRESGYAVLALQSNASLVTLCRWQAAVHEAEKLGSESGEEPVRERAQLCGQGQHAPGLSRAEGLDDLAGGALDVHGEAGQTVADAEPRVLRAMVPLEEGVARAAGPHQARVDRRDQ